MTVPTSSQHGVGILAANEHLIVVGTQQSWTEARRPAVFAHGSGDGALSVYGKAGQRALIQALAQRYTVAVPDLGLETWGNDVGWGGLDTTLDYLASAWNSTGPAVLVSASMGTLNTFGFALRQPARVRALAAIIPALDLAQIKALGGSFATLIDAAYPPSYNDGTDGPTHSPVQYAATMNARLPVHLFTSSNDPYAAPSTATAFVAARPQTERTNLGAVSHDDGSVGVAVSPVAAYVEQFWEWAA